MVTSNSKLKKTILWWGRFDPYYSRNQILRNILLDLKIDIVDFIPRSSVFGRLEAKFQNFNSIDAVWVPSFRQRDYFAAYHFSRKNNIPIIFDPLISAWDKEIFEKEKIRQGSKKERRLKRWEQAMFSSSDIVLADTAAHAGFFVEELEAKVENTYVVPVGADEILFYPNNSISDPKERLEVLFYGSFIHLQGPETIAQAALLTPEVDWTFLGDGPLRKICETTCGELPYVNFENWTPYELLSDRIKKADILLGIFGVSEKAARVIPNKVYQSLACGKPLISRYSDVYPEGLLSGVKSGISFVEAGDSMALASSVKSLIADKQMIEKVGHEARKSYEKYFSHKVVKNSLEAPLKKIKLLQ